MFISFCQLHYYTAGFSETDFLEMELSYKIQKKFVVTADSNHGKRAAETPLIRNFNPDKPHEALVADITYIMVSSHWAYLFEFINLYSHRVVVGTG